MKGINSLTCTTCHGRLPTGSHRCVHCGARIVRIESGVMKTSAVLVASGGTRCVYASLREVPEPLRQRVIECTSGRNSGTILIADRRGKEEIEKASRSERPCPVPKVRSGQRLSRNAWTIAVALLIVICGAAAVFFARA